MPRSEWDREAQTYMETGPVDEFAGPDILPEDYYDAEFTPAPEFDTYEPDPECPW